MDGLPYEVQTWDLKITPTERQYRLILGVLEILTINIYLLINCYCLPLFIEI